MAFNKLKDTAGNLSKRLSKINLANPTQGVLFCVITNTTNPCQSTPDTTI